MYWGTTCPLTVITCLVAFQARICAKISLSLGNETILIFAPLYLLSYTCVLP